MFRFSYTNSVLIGHTLPHCVNSSPWSPNRYVSFLRKRNKDKQCFVSGMVRAEEKTKYCSVDISVCHIYLASWEIFYDVIAWKVLIWAIAEMYHGMTETARPCLFFELIVRCPLCSLILFLRFCVCQHYDLGHFRFTCSQVCFCLVDL